MRVGKSFLAAASFVVLMCVVTYAQDEGGWQGKKPPEQTTKDAVSQVEVSQFQVGDTGGSGGMFGKGDIRQKLLDVAFWKDGSHGVACGVAGAFYTEDGGMNWKRIRPNPDKTMYYCTALGGPKDIWLAEGKHPHKGRHLWHSTDAGKSWEDVSERFPDPFKSVWDLVVRGQNIWLLAGGQWSFSYRSDDGGKTWEKLDILPGTSHGHTHAAIPASASQDELKTVYVLGGRREDGQRQIVLARTDDGGKQWDRVDLPKDLPSFPSGRYEIAFATPKVGMIGLPAAGLEHVDHGVWEKDPGASASVLVTTDGGENWTRRHLPNEELMITALWVDPSDTGHAFAGVMNGWDKQKGGPRKGPALYETFDAGKHWHVCFRGQEYLYSITGFDNRHVWAVGDLTGHSANDVVAILSEPGGKK